MEGSIRVEKTNSAFFTSTNGSASATTTATDDILVDTSDVLTPSSPPIMRESPPPSTGRHSFIVKTYKKPTNCTVCNKILWGIARQGFSCAYCHSNVHKKCMAAMGDHCQLATSARRHSSVDMDSITSLGSESSLHQQSSAVDLSHDHRHFESSSAHAGVDSEELLMSMLMMNTGADEHGDVHHETPTAAASDVMSISSSHDGQPAAANSVSAHESTSTPNLTRQSSRFFNFSNLSGGFVTAANTAPPTPPSVVEGLVDHPARKPSVIRSLLETTAEKAAELRKQSRGPPKLKILSTLPKNFTRFVMKVGPLSALQYRIEGIFAWAVPSETFLVMAIYTLLCLNPFLLMLLPHLAFIGLIGYNYYIHLGEQASKKKSKLSKQDSSRSIKPIDPKQIYPEEIHYRKNMQFIQNTMGMYCDIYEACAVLHSKIDWSDAEMTRNILSGCVASFAVLLIVFSWIPWNIVFLVAGLIAFAMNTAVGLAVQSLIIRTIKANTDNLDIHRLAASVFRLDAAQSSFRPNGTSTHPVLTVEIFENQRWWAGLGWISHMLRNERSSWSDLEGTITLKSKDSYHSPTAFLDHGLAFTDSKARERIPDSMLKLSWKYPTDSDWVLDRNWNAADNLDEDAWAYTDHKWHHVNLKDGGSFITRRRRWIRNVTVDEAVHGVLEDNVSSSTTE
eukprot:Partr_v1_DN28244_c3_g1_i1_m76019 putative Integral peroxisomal membrane peroxin